MEMTPEQQKSLERVQRQRGLSPQQQRSLDTVKQRRTTSDDGAPRAVEEEGKWPGQDYAESYFPEGEKFPGYTLGHNWLGGMAKGVAELPNAVPNTANAAQALYDLHFGKGTGEVAPEDTWQPWLENPVQGDKTIDELNPVTPGWEGVEQAGKITGAALPAALTGGVPALLAAATALPATVKMGGTGGALVDQFMGTEDSHKWERTGEAALPLLFGGARAMKNLPRPAIIPKIPAWVKYGLTSGVLSQADPSTALGLGLSLMAPKVVNKMLVRKPKGVKNDLNQMVVDTAVPLRLAPEAEPLQRRAP